MAPEDAAQVLMGRIETLGRYSEDPGMLLRRSFSPALRRANDAVAAWMRGAGMVAGEDAIGNLIGRYEGVTMGAPALVLGSHLDTVRDAGKYDGPLGVLAALACVERLQAEGRRLAYAVEVIAFTDEEGLRFHTSYLGSSAYTGTFKREWLDLRDADGVAMAAALRDFGGDPGGVLGCRRDPSDVLGYCEVHIEQGPVLEAEGLPVGVVSAIAGQDRVTVTITGAAGHAGTVPMSLRHDALCAAAEIVLLAERVAHDTEGLVATVGQIDVQPGASNVIPGYVTLSLDVRHRDDAVRAQAYRIIRDRAQAIADRRGAALGWDVMQSSNALPCSEALTGLLAHAIESVGLPVRHLPSGAGHDAVSMSRLTDVAMLFVRCRGGISHNPAESITLADAAVAIEVLYRFVTGYGGLQAAQA